jgi:integrase/recombinase XerD
MTTDLDTHRPERLAVRAGVDHRRLAASWTADLWAEAAAGLRASGTVEIYARNLRPWLAWLDRRALDTPTPADVLLYAADVRAKGLAPATVNAHLDAVRGLYRWAETRNAYPAIGRSVRGLPVRKDEPLECLSRADVAGLLAHVGRDLQGVRDAALVHVLFGTGLRLVSLCSLDVADLDTAAGVLTYRGKGDAGKARKAFLAPGALAALARYLHTRRGAEGADLPPAAPLFAAVGNRAGGKRLTLRSVRRVIVGLMERAGHVYRDGAGKILRPRVLSAHSLRRSAITAAYDAAGLEAAQALAGHADPKTTTRHYARVNKARLLRGLAAALDLPDTEQGRPAGAPAA